MPSDLIGLCGHRSHVDRDERLQRSTVGLGHPNSIAATVSFD
jgi:hypothetical protein